MMNFTSLSLLFCLVLPIITAKPFLIFANKNDIRLINVAAPRTNSSILIRQLEDAAVLDFYYKEGIVFWTDISLEMIKQTTVNVKNPLKSTFPASEKNVITSGLISPDGLACDWLGKKLYWTDSETNRIEVANLDGSFRKVLFWQDLYQPRAIAVVPMKGIMFWTDWGEIPKIERASMDGNLQSRRIIVSKKIYWPNGLTVDYIEEKVYFADARLSSIESINYDGSGRKTILKGMLSHPFAITVYKDRLYWTDWQTRSIHMCNKRRGKHVTKLIGGHLSPMDIHVFAPERQPPGTTSCDVNNGGCSHLCLMSRVSIWPGQSHMCACPTGVRLLDNNRTCAQGAENILLLARRSDIRRISLDTQDHTDVVLPLDDIKHTIAIDYDPIDRFIYWTDDEVPSLRRALMDGTEQQDLVVEEVYHPDGIAVDWIARNLYWTDTGTNRIEVSRLNGTCRRVLFAQNLDEPRAIVVDPQVGFMYWADWGIEAKIERAYMDGTNRQVIVNTSLGWPNGLAIDYFEQTLYWGDARTDKIERSKVDGTERVTLISNNLPHIFGFSILGDYIYWTDWQGRKIEKARKKDGGGRKIIVDHLPDLMGLKAVNVNYAAGTSACVKDNGHCSHLCLIRPDNDYVCACPMGLELSSDNRTCFVPEAFLLLSRIPDIRRLPLKLNRQDSIIPVAIIKEVSTLDFHFADNKIYWTDIGFKKISRANINGSDVETVVQFGLVYPEGMAVDWVARNIYWADVGLIRIEVASLDSLSRKVLIWKDLESPRSIALDPTKGYMYWSDWVTHQIERAALDGSERKVFVNRINKANSLTIDFDSQTLYWVDVDSNSIESTLLDDEASTVKKRRKVIINRLKQPYSMTLYQDYIYWAEWSSNSIKRANKTDGSHQTVVHANLKEVLDLSVFHGSRQPGWNECAIDNGGCSHLCLAKPLKKTSRRQHTFVRASCSCPTNHKMKEDNKTCQPPVEFLLFSQKNKISQMTLDNLTDSPDVILPIHGLKKIKSIDYDPVSEYLYWIDDRSKTIRRSFTNGTNLTVVVHSHGKSSSHPYDIAIDPYSGLLYYTCAINDVINVTRLADLSSIGVLFNRIGFKPRSLAINMHRGYLFFVNLVENEVSIERTELDGSHVLTLFKTELKHPTSLAVDVHNDLLFWSDEELNRIESSDIFGGNRRILVQSQTSRPHAVTVYKTHIYWIDKETKRIEKADASNGWNRQSIKNGVSQLSDIVAIENITQEQLNAHPCYSSDDVDSRFCSHICLIDVKDGWGRRRCSCPVNLVLSADDSRTCVIPPTCAPNNFVCHSGIECIPENWKCDRQSDCHDGSDEMDCKGKPSSITSISPETGLVVQPTIKRPVVGGNSQMNDADGVKSADAKKHETSYAANNQPSKMIIMSISIPVTIIVILIVIVIWRRCYRSATSDSDDDNIANEMRLMPPKHTTPHVMIAGPSGPTIPRGIVPHRVSNDMFSCSSGIPFERNVTGASSSSSNCVTLYKETRPPPPSLASASQTLMSSCTESDRYCPSCAGGPAPSLASTGTLPHRHFRHRMPIPTPSVASYSSTLPSSFRRHRQPRQRMYVQPPNSPCTTDGYDSEYFGPPPSVTSEFL